MNEVTIAVDALLDMVSKLNYDVKSGRKDWESIYEDTISIAAKARKTADKIELRYNKGGWAV